MKPYTKTLFLQNPIFASGCLPAKERNFPKKEEGVDTTKVVKSAKTELIVAKNRQGITDSVNLIFKGAQSVFVSEGSMEKKKQGEK